MSKKTNMETLAEFCLGWLIIVIIFFIGKYGPNPFKILHDIAESTGTGVLPFIVFVLIVIASCVLFFYYGTRN